jgi:hypothetical protein
MRSKRKPDTDEQRNMRAERRVEERKNEFAAESYALDVAVRRSISQFGA